MCVCAANVSNLVIQLVRPCIICVNSFATMSAPSSGRQRLQRQVSESILNKIAAANAEKAAVLTTEEHDAVDAPSSGRQRLQRQVSESILDQIAAANDAEAAVPTTGEHDADRASSEMDACTFASTDTNTEPDSCIATIHDPDSDSHSSWSSTFWTS